MRDRYRVVQNFYAQAQALRARFDEHIGNAFSHGPEHEIWNYWYAPKPGYIYMRTDPRKIFAPEMFQPFYDALVAWSTETLGLSDVEFPRISLYVNGCGQGLHNDARNGHWGYVYSLTRWDQRKFSGGETLLFGEDNYWDADVGKFREARAGADFYELIPPLFNQLLVFDDRVIHAVQTIQGSMDPIEGRIAIHGHIRRSGVLAQGGLSQEQAEQVFNLVMPDLMKRVANFGPYYHGLLSVRLMVTPEGVVEDVITLSDRILKVSPLYVPEPDVITQEVIAYLRLLQFPKTAEPSRISVPIFVE